MAILIDLNINHPKFISHVKMLDMAIKIMILCIYKPPK